MILQYWQAAQRNAELPPAEVKELRKKLWDKIDTETLLEERQNIYGHGRASNVKPYTSKTSIDDQANPQPPNQEGIRERVKKQIPNRKNINNQVKQPTPNQNIIDDELIGDEGPQTRHQKARQTILRKIEAKRKEEEDMVRRGCDIQRKLDEAWQKVAEAMAEEDDCEADLKAIREEIRELERHLGIPANRPQMKRRKTTNIGNTRSEFTIIPPTGPLRAQGKELMQEGVSWLQGVKPGEVVMNVPLHAAALASKARSSLSRYRGPAITGPGTGPLPAVL
ncbi:MAG: hypothetical protein M1823_004840 [Watsoniomyces obsoletus]|nr:MAG: hypothetical protein M1823_004840 [Watsoniomyces obsoletus]